VESSGSYEDLPSNVQPGETQILSIQCGEDDIIVPPDTEQGAAGICQDTCDSIDTVRIFFSPDQHFFFNDHFLHKHFLKINY